MESVDQDKLHYEVVVVEDGRILQSIDNGFLVARIKDAWTLEQQALVTKQFEQALKILNNIAAIVANSSGTHVQKSLYVLGQQDMVKLLNSIPGMSQVSSYGSTLAGEDIAVNISNNFFLKAFEGLADVTPLLSDFFERIAEAQQTAKSMKINTDFGTITGTVSMVPGLNIILTSFRYVSCKVEYTQQFLKILCLEAKTIKYNFEIVTVGYAYRPS